MQWLGGDTVAGISGTGAKAAGSGSFRPASTSALGSSVLRTRPQRFAAAFSQQQRQRFVRSRTMASVSQDPSASAPITQADANIILDQLTKLADQQAKLADQIAVMSPITHATAQRVSLVEENVTKMEAGLPRLGYHTFNNYHYP